MPDLYNLTKYSTYAVTALVGAFFFLVYKFQNSIIYSSYCPFDSRKFVYSPRDFEMDDYEDIDIITKDGVKIKAYLIKTYKDEKKTKISNTTLLYFHANAGNMGHRLPIAKSFVEECKCNIFIISYRGYGFSEGKSTEEGIKIDAQSSLEYILKHPEIKDTKIIVFGQSIGGAVAIDLASKNQDKISGIILENTFLSLERLIPAIFPLLTHLTFLCHEKWESYKSITKITKKFKSNNGKENFIPILFLNSELDEIVPCKHFEELCNIIRNERRKVCSKEEQFVEEQLTEPDTPNQKLVREQYNVHWYRFDGVNHNDTCTHPDYYKCIKFWWRKNFDE